SIFSGDGKEFYYAVDIAGKAEIRFMRLHKGLWTKPVTLISDEVFNTGSYEADVFVASDESYLIFCGDRADGYGRGDLYIGFKKPDGTWTRARNMERTINTTGH